MVYRITNDGFAENAVYHATCMTNYLLKRIKDDSGDYLTSEHSETGRCVTFSSIRWQKFRKQILAVRLK
jgi:predicted phage gp36 major capsid-like protein